MSRVLARIKFGGGFDGKYGDIVEERRKRWGKILRVSSQGWSARVLAGQRDMDVSDLRI